MKPLLLTIGILISCLSINCNGRSGDDALAARVVALEHEVAALRESLSDLGRIVGHNIEATELLGKAGAATAQQVFASAPGGASDTLLAKWRQLGLGATLPQAKAVLGPPSEVVPDVHSALMAYVLPEKQDGVTRQAFILRLTYEYAHGVGYLEFIPGIDGTFSSGSLWAIHYPPPGADPNDRGPIPTEAILEAAGLYDAAAERMGLNRE